MNIPVQKSICIIPTTSKCYFVQISPKFFSATFLFYCGHRSEKSYISDTASAKFDLKQNKENKNKQNKTKKKKKP